MEERSIEAGEDRIKFVCNRVGSISEVLKSSESSKKRYYQLVEQLSDALLEQEKHGLSPLIPADGKIAGNGAAKIEISNTVYTLVTKSGKEPGEIHPLNSMCLIREFNTQLWRCEYYSEGLDIKPTSDTPMHYCVLNATYNSESPTVALHGHALASKEDAARLNLPSSRETLFSTPEDTEVMLEMLQKYVYPEHKVFVRLNHGYYILGQDVRDCQNVLREKIVKYL